MRMKPLKRSLAVMTAGLLSTALQAETVALGQSDGMADDFSMLVLEELVVTAQRKKESQLESPVSVNLIEGSTIRNHSVFAAPELSKFTAGLSVTQDNGQNSGVAVRGIGTAFTQLAPPRVSVNLDDLDVASRLNFAFANLYDIENVQLLRGPQGTLYGQPSPSGALLIKTADPDLDVSEGYISASVVDPKGHNVQGAYSVPLVDGVLALRIAGNTEELRSDVKNITRDDREKRVRDNYRIKLLWSPIEELKMKFGFANTDIEGSDFMPVVETAKGLSPPAVPEVLKPDDRKSITDSRVGVDESSTDSFSFNLDWDLDEISLHWYTAGWDRDETTLEDRDYTAASLTHIEADTSSDSLQHELRIIGQVSDRWEYQVGGYYAEGNVEGGARTVAFTPANLVFPLVDSVSVIDLDLPLKTDRWAVFTHNEFKLTDSTTLVLGLRYNEWADKSGATQTQTVHVNSAPLPDGMFTAGTATPVPVPALIDSSRLSYHEVTGTLKISHQVNDATTLYATYDRGFRPGSFNFDTQGFTSGTELGTYDGEEVDTLELGAKGKALDGRAQYTVAAYYAEYDNFQTLPEFAVFNPRTGSEATARAMTVNIDEVQQWGIEAEGRILLNDNFTLFMSANYTNVEAVDSTIPCTDPAQPAVSAGNRFNVCDIDGEPATIEPKWAGLVQLDYVREASGLDGEWYATGLLNYRGGTEVLGDTTGRLESGPYRIFDAHTGYRNDSWGVKLWVKNAFDEDAVRRRSASSDPRYIWVRMEPGRSAGVTADYRF